MTVQTMDQLVLSPGETQTQDFEETRQQSGAGSANGAATASQQNQVKYVPTETRAAYWGPGSLTTFIITGKDTGGAFSWLKCLSGRAAAHRRTSTTEKMNRSTHRSPQVVFNVPDVASRLDDRQFTPCQSAGRASILRRPAGFSQSRPAACPLL